MRLTCPNCDAQYEVPTDVIPPEGRDVQCSNCGRTWYQYHPDHMPDDEDQDTSAPAPQPAAATPPPAPEVPLPKRRALDKGVADILNEEAAVEEAARAGERQRGTPEAGPELGVNVAEFVEKNTVTKAGMPPSAAPMAAAAGAAVATAATARQEVLPDVEEINSSLRSSADREARKVGDVAIDGPTTHKRKRRGFSLGFWIVLLLFVIGALAYIFAPQIVERVPQAAEPLAQYVEIVDNARVWIDGQIQKVMQMLDSSTGGDSGANDQIDVPSDNVPAPQSN